MNFDICYFITGERKPSRSDIPECYHEFLPENLEKDRHTYPYSYSAFLIYFNKDAKQPAKGTCYTDRFYQQNIQRHNELCKKHFGNEGQHWNDREPEKIQAFLCDWIGKEVTLIANIQYCNVRSGYPVWRLDYREKE